MTNVIGYYGVLLTKMVNVIRGAPRASLPSFVKGTSHYDSGPEAQAQHKYHCCLLLKGDGYDHFHSRSRNSKSVINVKYILIADLFLNFTRSNSLDNDDQLPPAVQHLLSC